MLRLIQVILPKGREHRVPEILEEFEYLDLWEEPLQDDRVSFKILVEGEHAEEIIDELQGRLGWIEEFRIVLFAVEASIPRPEPKEDEKEKESAEEKETVEEKPRKQFYRLSREELYSKINEMGRTSSAYIVLTVLSAIVAAIGIYAENVAVIIGAMVIAPLLGPNIAFSFATTLGDNKLAVSSGRAILVGIIITLVVSTITGIIFDINPASHEIARLTNVGVSDIILAVAAGSAGAISITLEVATVLVGVMVAVALLPPLVTCGLLLGAGFVSEAESALMLFLINIVCINISAVAVFLAEGIRPNTWWESEKAKRSSLIALALWAILLTLLIISVVLLG